MNSLLDIPYSLVQTKAITTMIAKAGKSELHLLLTGLHASAQAMVLADLLGQTKQHQLIILEDSDAANYLQSDLSKLLPDRDALFFPSSKRIRQKVRDDAYLIARTEVLNRLAQPKPCIVITYPEAIAETVAKPNFLQSNTITLHKADHISMERLQQQLVDVGFERVDFVYEPKQYAVRGGILDVFSFSHELPYRLDFFGDEIDSIREFDIETQLSRQKVESIDIISEMADENEDGYLTDYFPQKSLLVTTNSHIAQCKLDSLTENKLSLDTFKKTIELSEHSSFTDFSSLSFSTLPQPIFHKNFDLFVDDLRQKTDHGYTVFILSESKKQLDRIQTILAEKSAEQYLDAPRFEPISNVVLHEGFVDNEQQICVYTDHQIFERFHRVQQKSEMARQGKAVLTLKEINQLSIGDYVVHEDHGIGQFGGLVHTTISGKPQEMIKLIFRDNGTLFVSIHNLHRISKYKGKEGSAPNISKLGSSAWERMKERTKNKVKDIARDLIQLYAARKSQHGYQYSSDTYLQHELEASFLYEDTPDQAKATLEMKRDMESPIPMDRLICGDVGFGKTEVAIRAAFKAATDGKQVAVLVPTTVLAMQHYNTFRERLKDFPVSIEYISRAKPNKEIKNILQRLKEGKIDILIGTHKIVSKQVVFKDLGLLIIDEEQKFGVTTKEKLRALQVNVDTLTMTATPIPRTLQFSLLGARDLTVMTTPPPNRYPVQTEVISSADEEIIQEAIQREMARNGQVFVINNLIQGLPTLQNKIHRLVPEARIVIAHGQLPPDELEERLTDFINYDYDVLLATSIVESGIDIPNVNTIIIHGAQHFGLADLHQLRGRVGRSNKKAFCYLVAPESELLTPEARRRLQAIETFSDMGSGFHLAMQDLDIRGAGNMLGAEQSGFIADLGYETYQHILEEAIHELRTEEFSELFENDEAEQTQSWKGMTAQRNWVTDSQLDTDLEVGFPADYVENISERIALYRELDNLTNEDALTQFQIRLVDRFGTIPEAGKELLQVVRMRWLCMQMGIEKVILKQEKMMMYFPNNPDNSYFQSDMFGQILNFVVHNPRRCQLRENNDRRSAVILQVHTINEAYAILQQIMQTPCA